MSDYSEAEFNAQTGYLQGLLKDRETKAITLNVNLIVCLEMLREAGSPYVPSSGRDNEWLARRDRVVKNAEAALSDTSVVQQ